MEEPEIICLSSDDEEVKKIDYPALRSILKKTKIKTVRETVLLNLDKNSNNSGKKRKLSQNASDSDSSDIVNKKMKLPTILLEDESENANDSDSSDIVMKNMKLPTILLEDELQNANDSDSAGIVKKKRKLPTILKKAELQNTKNNTECTTTSSSSSPKKKDCNIAIVKPQLIMKEKRCVSPVEQDVFPMLISLCLQKDHSKDMEVIVEKLKRNYEQLDTDYAKSEDFRLLLNEKREAIANDKGIYRNIANLNETMKENRKGKVRSVRKVVNANQVPVPSSSSNISQNPENLEEVEVDDEEDSENDRRLRAKVKSVLKAIKKCKKEIARLEEKEVDFDEENDSSYIKLEKYKERIVTLYNVYCKLTGENADAGRPYLRPKHFSSTQIVAVDQAISSFINSKIINRHKKKKGTLTDCVLFPDYFDILQCIAKCNETHNLGLSKTKQERIAKKAFTELGEHLQRARQQDYWDTFSLFLEGQVEDPALKNTELAEKLKKNRHEGEERIKNLFEEYVKKQEDPEYKDEEEEEEDEIEEDEIEADDNDDVPLAEVEIDSCEEHTLTKDKKEKIDDNPKQTKLNSQKLKIDCAADKNDLADSKSAIIIADTVDKSEKSVDISRDSNIVRDGDKNKEDHDVRQSKNEITENSDVDTKNNETEREVGETVTEDLKKKGQRLPLLRVRSFAKPPTTWIDNQQNTGVVQQKQSSKIIFVKRVRPTFAIDTANPNGVSLIPISHNSSQKMYQLTVVPKTLEKNINEKLMNINKKHPPSGVDAVKTNLPAKKSAQPTTLIRLPRATAVSTSHTKSIATTTVQKLSKNSEDVSVVMLR